MPVALYDVLRARAGAHPEAPAFTVPGRGTLTYGEWFGRAEARRGRLGGAGLAAGEPVLLAFPDERWQDMATWFAAVLGAGGVAVPVGQPLPEPRLALLASATGAAGVVSAGPAGEPAPPGARWRLDDGADPPTPAPAAGGAASPGLDGPAAILFTSGTTGVPRAIACPRAELAAAWEPGSPPPVPRRQALLTSVATGTAAALSVLRDCLLNGVHVVVAVPFDPDEVPELVRVHHVSAVSLVPTAARLAAAAVTRTGRPLTGVRSVVCSSGPLDRPTVAALAAAFPAATITNVYAVAEGGTGLAAECSPEAPPALGRLGPEVRVVGPDGADVGPGEVGELWLRGGGRRYLDGEAGAVGTRYTGTGWIATGDLAEVGADGSEVRFVSRADDVVLTGGRKVAPEEVESVLRECAGVREAAAFGVPHEALGQLLAAAVVLEEGGSVEAVREECAARLPAGHLPRQLVAVPELPLTPSGKVRRGELAARLAGSGAAAGPEPAAGDALAEETERMVAAALREVLGTDSVDRDSNFFALGGHSLIAGRLAVDLRERSGADVPADLVSRYPVVKDIAAALGRLRPRRRP